MHRSRREPDPARMVEPGAGLDRGRAGRGGGVAPPRVAHRGTRRRRRWSHRWGAAPTPWPSPWSRSHSCNSKARGTISRSQGLPGEPGGGRLPSPTPPALIDPDDPHLGLDVGRTREDVRTFSSAYLRTRRRHYKLDPPSEIIPIFQRFIAQGRSPRSRCIADSQPTNDGRWADFSGHRSRKWST